MFRRGHGALLSHCTTTRRSGADGACVGTCLMLARHGVGARHPLFIFLSLLLAGCQTIPVAPAQSLSSPPVWLGGENQYGYLMAATYHATQLINQTDADETAYLAYLADWGVEQDEYVWLRHVDLDNDGQQEVLLAYPQFQRPSGAVNAVSDCWRVDCKRLFFLFEKQARIYLPVPYLGLPGTRTYPFKNRPSLFAIDDINADGRIEVVLMEEWQGAHTEGVTLTILRWDGAKWEELGWLTQSYSDVRLIDIEGDGPQEFVLYGGTVGSAGAGFQRKSTDIYKWNGVDYNNLVASIPDAITSETPYWKIVDGNIALYQRRYAAAERLFADALSMLTAADGDVDSISEATGTSDRRLLALARFQAMYVALLRYSHDPTIATAHYVASQSEGGVYAAWAAAFWDVWSQTGNLDDACAAARVSVGDTMMEGYNYATNPLYFRNMLCEPHYTWPPE